MGPDGVVDEENLRRADVVLRHSVHAHKNRLSGEMLLVFTRLQNLRSFVGQREPRPAVEAALAAFATASLTAAFDRRVIGPDPVPEVLDVGVVRTDQADIRAAIDALDAVEREVHIHADGQEWVDANANAYQLRVAARWVRHARDQLASCLSDSADGAAGG